MDLYTHAMRELDADAAEKLGEVFGRSGSTPSSPAAPAGVPAAPLASRWPVAGWVTCRVSNRKKARSRHSRSGPPFRSFATIPIW